MIDLPNTQYESSIRIYKESEQCITFVRPNLEFKESVYSMTS
jgi:hypothetical protein